MGVTINIMMRSLFLAALVAVVSMAAPIDNEMLGAFQQYTLQFNKTYDSAELSQRLEAFVFNLRQIDELNTIEGEEVYGLTKFSDLTPKEFKARYLTYQRSSLDRSSVPVLDLDVAAGSLLNASGQVDWRTKKKVTPVKDQGQCGSCWAFSATEQIESAWLMAGNSQEILAPQQITSCDKKDEGCNGGDTPTAYKYVEKAGGMVTEKDYPYKSGKSGNSGKCSIKTKMKRVVSIKGFTYATPPKPDGEVDGGRWKANEAKMATAMSTMGPMSICVDATTWQNYKKGVVTKTCKQQLDHCVQAVGYNIGADAAKGSYWIVRNSWNTDWGEDGYIRVGYGGDYCGIANEATFVTL